MPVCVYIYSKYSSHLKFTHILLAFRVHTGLTTMKILHNWTTTVTHYVNEFCLVQIILGENCTIVMIGVTSFFFDISKLWFLLHNIIQMSYYSHYYFLNSSSSVFPDMYYFNVREILCSLFLLCVHVCVCARALSERDP